MSLLSEVYKLFGTGVGNIVDGFNMINIDGKAVYIDGVTRILEIGSLKIRVSTKKHIIDIEGEGLYLMQSIQDSVAIAGNIVSITKS